MLEETLKLANSPGLWICALITVSLVFIQSGLYLRLSYKEAKKIGFDKSNLVKSFRVGATTAVGPGISGLVVMVGLISAIGMPITWMRLSIIGATATELTAATVAAESMGISLGAANYSPEALSLAFFTMAINVAGWLLMVALFTHKMDDIQEKLGGGDPRWMNLITVGASIGVFAYLTAARSVIGLPPLLAAMSAVVTMFILQKWLNPKVKGLAEWSLGICMVVSMITGTIVASII